MIFINLITLCCCLWLILLEQGNLTEYKVARYPPSFSIDWQIIFENYLTFFCTSSQSMLRETRWKMKSREWHRLRSGELSCLISSWFKCSLVRQRTQACGIKENSALNITCLHISIVPKWASWKHVFKIPSFLCPSWSIAKKDYSVFALLMELKR